MADTAGLKPASTEYRFESGNGQSAGGCFRCFLAILAFLAILTVPKYLSPVVKRHNVRLINASGQFDSARGEALSTRTDTAGNRVPLALGQSPNF